ncbi:MAG: class I SAM-dependent methyltransferase [Candidatus Kapaibacterium sp.]
MLYDDQATDFDERAGLPADACEAVAESLVDIGGLTVGDPVLEIGAGTGMLSIPLIRRDVHYVGFDQSPAMLAVFSEKIASAGLAAQLHVADGNQRWPAEDGSIALVFCARALHHLNDDHVVAETLRVLKPGGRLVLGRVRRPNNSVKSTMRKQMRAILEAEGYFGRSHNARANAVFAELEHHGAIAVQQREAAHWTGTHRPADSISAWREKQGLAGIDVPPDVKERVLEQLRGWAAERYGDIEIPREQDEFFELDGIIMPRMD